MHDWTPASKHFAWNKGNPGHFSSSNDSQCNFTKIDNQLTEEKKKITEEKEKKKKKIRIDAIIDMIVTTQLKFPISLTIKYLMVPHLESSLLTYPTNARIHELFSNPNGPLELMHL